MSVGGLAVNAAFKAVILCLMFATVAVPIAAAAASVWFVFWKMDVSIGQFFAVCLMQFVCYVVYLIGYNMAQNPPTAG